MIDPSFYQNVPSIGISDDIYIRAMRIEDATDYLNYMRNPEVRKYVLVEKQLTLSYAMSHITYCKDLMRAHQGIFWAIATQEDDKMIGWLAFYTNNHDRRAEIAFDLAEEFWGQGIITAVISESLDYAFNNIELIRVSAILLKENIGSAKALEKNGFKFEGTWKNYKYFRGKCYDVDSYAITNDEFHKLDRK
jgi:ribosomal-protein-alanine N-acetyltransferase